MEKIIIIIQVVVSILLIILILMQNKEGGLGAVFGGGEGFQAVRRGPEKFIYNFTIVLAIIFMLNALLIVLV
jgi:preprotein translocase subunit SecG